MVFHKPKYLFDAPLLCYDRNLPLQSFNITLNSLYWHFGFLLYYFIVQLIMFPFTNHFRILVFVRIVIVFVINLFLLFCLNSKLWDSTLVTCDKHRRGNRLCYRVEQMTWHFRILVWIFHVCRYISLLSQVWSWIVTRFEVRYF